MVIVDVASLAWDGAGSLDLESLAVQAVVAALAGAAVERRAEVGVRLTDDAEIRSLNRQWRDRDAATNVLSFPLDDDNAGGDGAVMLGDVVVAYETVVAEASRDGKSLSDHLTHLVVHGVLHLVGFDHEQANKAEEMEALERRILAGLDVPDPYADSEAA
ncbi:MAG: rRNA maturation RNase YbeY [Alphaproteobacteria bacterium]|nr:rRNA maturation RNase YbeY [Alphaproteobacteria bacterium]|tara:strand:+ start:597 stop:1076 length:480 start_codon:yes stop_codon:yes gene_type:complete